MVSYKRELADNYLYQLFLYINRVVEIDKSYLIKMIFTYPNKKTF